MNKELRKHKILERYLNLFHFNGIRIGNLLAHNYALNYLNEQQAHPITINFISLLKYLITLFWSRKNRQEPQFDYIFTKINRRFHFNAMMDPLISHFLNRSLIVCNEDSFDKDSLDINVINRRSILIKHTTANNASDTSKIFKLVLTVLLFLAKNKKRLSLSFTEIIYFTNKLVIELRTFSFWDNYLAYSISKPRCVVTEFDRCNGVAPLILAAGKHKITTITLIHGVLEDYSFMPFLADYIFCWGQGQKSQLITWGIVPRRLIITGNPMFKTIDNYEDFVYKAKDQLIFCLAISPGSDNSKLINIFLSSLNRIDKVHGIIKLHPSQNKEEFNWTMDISTKVNVLSSSDIKNSELFKLIDLLIIFDSGIANEALVAGVPVAVMVPDDIPHCNNYQNELVLDAGCSLINSEASLLGLSRQIVSDPIKFRSSSIKNSKRYIENLFDSSGNDSVLRMIDEINWLSNSQIT